MFSGYSNWAHLLARHTRSVLQGNWAAAAAADAGATTVTGALADHAALTPTVLASQAGAYTGATLEWTGGANAGVLTTILAVSTSGTTTTLTLADALPNAVGLGDTFVVYAAMVTESLTVANRVVGAGQLVAVASGDEVFWNAVTVNGTLRINGAVYAGSVVVNLGGLIIFGDTGQLTTGAFA